MKRRLRALLMLASAVVMAMALSVGTASAHGLFPCNDGEAKVADVAAGATGANYAKHHIKALATTGGMGNDGHKPGSHRGFSLCNPSGK